MIFGFVRVTVFVGFLLFSFFFFPPFGLFDLFFFVIIVVSPTPQAYIDFRYFGMGVRTF